MALDVFGCTLQPSHRPSYIPYLPRAGHCLRGYSIHSPPITINIGSPPSIRALVVPRAANQTYRRRGRCDQRHRCHYHGGVYQARLFGRSHCVLRSPFQPHTFVLMHCLPWPRQTRPATDDGGRTRRMYRRPWQQYWWQDEVWLV